MEKLMNEENERNHSILAGESTDCSRIYEVAAALKKYEKS